MTISRPTHQMLRLVALAGLAIVGVATPSTAWTQQAERPLAQLGFMAGCWRGDAGGNQRIEEQWTAADSDVMLATTRYLEDNTGRTRAWEFSRIVADSAGIALIPAPEGTPRGYFRLAPSPAGEARFEDLEHDFPRRIIYRRIDERALAVRLEGGEGSGQSAEFRMQRVHCPAPGAP